MRLRAAGALALTAALLTGCAQSVDPIERLGMKAAGRVSQHGPGADRRLPPVVDRVRTTDKVVFLTYDDGAEKDPRFVDMVRERRLPVSMFLTDSVVGPGYGHFARLQSVGASIQNHTLDHAALPGLPYAGQRAEICGQQDKLRSRFGIRPRLFRPPHGRYDTTTRRAAADCGLSSVVLWTSADSDAAPLHPGDIILIGPDDPTGPPLWERTEEVLRRVAGAGLSVGRLEDYL
ncbi:polysaccharide deacetylase family protein [Streptomyces sp. GESEQ-35]|uniref:polysaccharide deacetylase family protein n=1 Tax=Streptomyces sp. GESEQ-35 TaxID=2812657 RepID=UPI0027E27B71|nr:polysaccharide deacetylase family protein [Streptomyces sp. GESEQ-35]